MKGTALGKLPLTRKLNPGRVFIDLQNEKKKSLKHIAQQHALHRKFLIRQRLRGQSQ